MCYLVIYQKGDGKTIFRINRTLPVSKIGEKSSMGWLILDIQYYFEGRYYDSFNYSTLLFEKANNDRNNIDRKDKIKNILKKIERILK